MKIADVGANAQHQLAGLFQIGLIFGMRIEPQIIQRRRHNLRRRIHYHQAAICQLGCGARVEHHVPAADLVCIDALGDHVDVIADPDREHHVGHAIGVVRVIHRDDFENIGVEIAVVLQLVLVDFCIKTSLRLAREKLDRGHYHIVAAGTGQHLGLQHLVAVEHVVIDRDTGFRFEIGNRIGGHIIRPVIDVQFTISPC